MSIDILGELDKHRAEWEHIESAAQAIDALKARLSSLMEARARPVEPSPASLRQFALARIAAMADRPLAWAATREAFGLQLVLLVEIGRGRPSHVEASREAMRAVFGPGPAIGEGYDEAWARQAAAAARALVEAAP